VDEPVAEVLLRVAVAGGAVGAEQGRHRVAAGLALRLLELLEGQVDHLVHRGRPLGGGLFHGPGDQAVDRVVGERAGDLLADQERGILVGDVELFPGGLALPVFDKLHEHGWTSGAERERVRDTGRPSPGGAGWQLGVCLRRIGPDGLGRDGSRPRPRLVKANPGAGMPENL
jgi:hypothetical protein